MHQDAVAIFQTAVESVRPSNLFPEILRESHAPRLLEWQNSPDRRLLSIGKAGMSSTDAILNATSVADYFVISPQAKIPPTLDPTKIHFGSHPLPGKESFMAADSMLQWIAQIPDNTPLLVVLSGGASALVASPAEGISQDSKTRLNDLLIRSGANISEINTVRKHCSKVKGGQTGLQVSKLQTTVLVISDVSNDDLSTIGSGPFYCDSTTFIAAREILKRYRIWDAVQRDIRMRIEAGVRGEIPETPKPGSISIPHTIVASNSIAREAAKQKAIESGFNAQVISEPLVQSVENAVQYLKEHMKLLKPRSALILGGEITVQVRGNGIGGRNQHFALLMTKEIAQGDIVFLSAGTDGIDGNSNAAGAWTDSDTMKKASSMNLSIEQSIVDFNSFEFFKTLNQSIITGPTGTNVMDLYLLIRQ